MSDEKSKRFQESLGEARQGERTIKVRDLLFGNWTDEEQEKIDALLREKVREFKAEQLAQSSSTEDPEEVDSKSVPQPEADPKSQSDKDSTSLRERLTFGSGDLSSETCIVFSTTKSPRGSSKSPEISESTKQPPSPTLTSEESHSNSDTAPRDPVPLVRWVIILIVVLGVVAIMIGLM